MELSIIIINFKTPQLVIDCISSIHNTMSVNTTYEIIVIDNDSQDDSEEMVTSNFQNIIWINNQTNEGFGRANNIGIKHSKGDYLLFINSDIILGKETINETLKFIKQRKDIGLLGCKLLNKDGSIQNSIYRNFGTLRFILGRNIILSYFFNFDESKIKALMGAYMLIPKKVISKVNGFDPEFFMYSEEIELCNRIQKAGYQLYYFDKHFAYHLNEGSSKGLNWISHQRILSNALLILKTQGYVVYYIYFFLKIVNTITNFFAMWLLDNDYRKAFYREEELFYSNIRSIIKIPFIYNRRFVDGKNLLRYAK